MFINVEVEIANLFGESGTISSITSMFTLKINHLNVKNAQEHSLSISISKDT